MGVKKSHKTWVVREVRHHDLAGLEAVIDASGLFPSTMLDSMIAPFLEGNSVNDLWFTVEDKSPMAIGYCAPERMTDGTWNMLLLAVHPDRQGEGIGSSIMSSVELLLRERGARILLVETSGSEDFAGTRAFYNSIGYTQEARIRDFYQGGDDKIVFRKDFV